jgi:hypothetical protein
MKVDAFAFNPWLPVLFEGSTLPLCQAYKGDVPAYRDYTKDQRSNLDVSNREDPEVHDEQRKLDEIDVGDIKRFVYEENLPPG